MTDDSDRMLRPKQVAHVLGVSRSTVERLRARDRTFPRFVRLTPGVRVMSERALRLWLRKRLQQAEVSDLRAAR